MPEKTVGSAAFEADLEVADGTAHTFVLGDDGVDVTQHRHAFIVFVLDFFGSP